MPLPDPSTQQQTELLREMRDEMRSIRAQGGGMGTSRADGLYRPPNTFVRGQLTTDRIMSGEFANFGWTQAYNHLYRPSLMGDVVGAMGFARAPASMTQAEFQEMAQQRISAFPGDLLTGVFAPGFRNRTNNLAQDILANSPRFMRFGDSTSAFGAGFTYTGSRALARNIQLEAIGDIRLSSEDYSTITSTGMRGGQFDAVRGAGQFMQRMRELAQVTADLTRTMHMGVGDISQAMAQMRAVGVTDVATQRREIMNMGAAAQVAGIAPGQMLSATMTAAQRGLQMGFAAPSTMDLAAGNIAQARQLRRHGLMDANILAAGGGAVSIAQQITQQQQQFVGSDAGLMAFIGQRAGAEGGFIQQMMGGLQGVAGRGFGGMLETRMDRMNILANMTAQEQRDLFRSSIEQQVQLLGVDDITSRRGQAAAFNVLTGQGMGDPAALAFVRSNFSPEGRRAASAAEYLRMRAEDFQERKLEDNRVFEQRSFMGRFHTARAQTLQQMARYGTGVARALEMGQTGTFGFGAQLDVDVQRLEKGTLLQTAGLGDQAMSAIEALRGGPQIGAANQVMTLGSMHGRTALSNAVVGGSAIGGAWLGTKIGAGLGSFLGPIGTVAGGVLGAIGGFATGAFAGTYAAGLIPAEEREAQLSGRMVGAGREVFRALATKTPTAKARDLLDSGIVNRSQVLRRLVSGRSKRELGAEGTAELVRQVDAATSELRFLGENVTRGDVMHLLKLSGVEIDAAEVLGVGAGRDVSLRQYRDLVENVLTGSANEIEGSLLDSRSAGMMADYFEAIQSRDVAAIGRARGRLMHERGLTGEQIDDLTTSFRGLGAGARGDLTRAARGAAESGTRTAASQGLGVFAKYARSIVGAAAGPEAEAAQRQLADLTSGGNMAEILPELLQGQSALARTLIEENSYVRSAVSGVRGTDFARINAETLSARFGFSDREAKEFIRKRESGDLSEKDLQTAALFASLTDPALEARGVKEDIERDTVAASLNNAAQILERLVNELNLNKASKESAA